MNNEKMLVFPEDFVFGAATSSYQIEGALDTDGRGLCIWQDFSSNPANIEDGKNAVIACDHYHRFRDDIGLMNSLDIKNYRFSISWPRILPEGTGEINGRGLDFYDRLVDGLLEVGITPWVTLFHWDLPSSLQHKGGWTNRDVIEAFASYTDIVSRRLGDRVKNWITQNEPWVVAFLGHLYGVHAPGIRDLPTALSTAHGIMVSHGIAVRVLRQNIPDARVGMSHNLEYVEPASRLPEDAAATIRHDGAFNRWFLDPLFFAEYPTDMIEYYGKSAPEILEGDMRCIAEPIDFLGVNFYTRRLIRHDERVTGTKGFLKTSQVYRPYIPRGHFNEWEMNPDGFFRLLERLNIDYPKIDIYITENGTSLPDKIDASGRVDDSVRIRYLARHLAAVHEAIRCGVQVKGYFLWSLMDNYEWAFGFNKRFGIIHVDYNTQHRTIKDSGRWYSNVCHNRGFLRSDADSFEYF